MNQLRGTSSSTRTWDQRDLANLRSMTDREPVAVEMFRCPECPFTSTDLRIAFDHRGNEITWLQERLTEFGQPIGDRHALTDEQVKEAAGKVRALRRAGIRPPRQQEDAAKEHHRRRSAEWRQRQEESRIGREVGDAWQRGGLTGARKARKWTQPELARRSGINDGLISKVERGLAGLSVDSWLQLFGALGMMEQVAALAPIRRTRRISRKRAAP